MFSYKLVAYKKECSSIEFQTSLKHKNYFRLTFISDENPEMLFDVVLATPSRNIMH